MTTPFSKLLVQLRKEAGFPTAYRFYHDNGGNGVLKISYRNYLMIEQGRSLPGLERLGTFLWALHLFLKSAEANTFVSAWLETMAGPEHFKELFKPLLAAKQGAQGLSPMQNAMKKAMTNTKIHLSMAQMEAIFANQDNHLCFHAITNDTGAWPKKEFAARLQLTEAAAEKALKALARVKIVKEVKKGVYKSPMAGALLQYPRRELLPQEFCARMQEYGDELAATGKRVLQCRTMVRADGAEFNNFYPVMQVNNDTAATYAIEEKTDRSALYLVEGKITKIRDF